MTAQMERTYTTKCNFCRWPLQVIFITLHLADINALYKTAENISRQDVLLQLAVEIAADFREDCEQPATRINTKATLPKSDSHQRTSWQMGYWSKNKTIKICSSCEKYVWKHLSM